MTPKSRADVPEYADINETVNTLVGQINGRYGEPAWTPIRYVNRAYSRASLAALYRMARVGLVTPLRDGMNLVAKEYVAAQDAEDPGVLVLSQFAGAAEELGTARSSSTRTSPRRWPRRSMPRCKCRSPSGRQRYRRMFRHLAANDIDRWAEPFLAALMDARHPPRIFSNLRQLFAARS